MKKIFILFILTFCLTSLVSCKNCKKDSGDDEECLSHVDSNLDGKCDKCDKVLNNNNNNNNNNNTSKIYDNSPHKDKWDYNDYGSYAYGVWDSTVLPDYFPTEPTIGAIKDIETSYHSKDDKQLSASGSFGKVYSEENIETFGVSFYGQDEHYDYLKTNLENQGFITEEEWKYSYFEGAETLNALHAFRTDAYVFIHITSTDTYEGYTKYYSVDAIGKVYTLPTSFEGLPLFDAGYLTQEPGYSAYDTTTPNYDYSDWTFDRKPLATNIWGIFEMTFYGVKYEDYSSYITKIKNAGWNITSQTEPGDYSNNYNLYANLDGKYVFAVYNPELKQFTFGMSNDSNFWG